MYWGVMTKLVAITYRDQSTAVAAMESLTALETYKDLVRSNGIVAVVRKPNGRFRTVTEHHPVRNGAIGGLILGTVLGTFFFAPVVSVALGGGLGAIAGEVFETHIDKGFRDEVRSKMDPGTSTLFLVLDTDGIDDVLAELVPFGGDVLATTMTRIDADRFEAALHHAT
jgi:uncharacterized membrane protein